MKYSKQREMIFNTVMEHPIHPTADQVYDILRKQLPNISLGTVYRNLNLLTEMDKIHKIPIPNQGDCFDGRTDQHYHFICEQCKSVIDLDFDFTEEINRQLEQKNGFLVNTHELLIRGICSNCQHKIAFPQNENA